MYRLDRRQNNLYEINFQKIMNVKSKILMFWTICTHRSDTLDVTKSSTDCLGRQPQKSWPETNNIKYYGTCWNIQDLWNNIIYHGTCWNIQALSNNINHHGTCWNIQALSNNINHHGTCWNIQAVSNNINYHGTCTCIFNCNHLLFLQISLHHWRQKM